MNGQQHAAVHAGGKCASIAMGAGHESTSHVEHRTGWLVVRDADGNPIRPRGNASSAPCVWTFGFGGNYFNAPSTEQEVAMSFGLPGATTSTCRLGTGCTQLFSLRCPPLCASRIHYLADI